MKTEIKSIFWGAQTNLWSIAAFTAYFRLGLVAYNIKNMRKRHYKYLDISVIQLPETASCWLLDGTH